MKVAAVLTVLIFVINIEAALRESRRMPEAVVYGDGHYVSERTTRPDS